MIKLQTLGMYDVAKNIPNVKATKETTNYSFMKHDEDICLVMNEQHGDASYQEGYTIQKDEYLNLFLVKAWEGQCLIVDGKHIDNFSSNKSDGTKLVIDEATGKLKQGEPAGEVHFVVKGDPVFLTEEAVVVKVMVATEAA